MPDTLMRDAVVPGYYLVCYNPHPQYANVFPAVVPGYYLVCYNSIANNGDFKRRCSSRLLLGML